MKTREDIEAYLVRSGHPHRELDDHTWLVGDPSGTRENIVVRLDERVCYFRMKVIELSAIEASKAGEFYFTLLELNASDMVHGAYCAADGMILVAGSLLLENLDYNEFAELLEDFFLTITNHYSRLATFHRKTA